MTAKEVHVGSTSLLLTWFISGFPEGQHHSWCTELKIKPFQNWVLNKVWGWKTLPASEQLSLLLQRIRSEWIMEWINEKTISIFVGLVVVVLLQSRRSYQELPVVDNLIYLSFISNKHIWSLIFEMCLLVTSGVHFFPSLPYVSY